jgi:hypothetical protein
MPRENKFIKARHHLSSTQIDERIRALSEGPTNNTSGYYVIEPDIVTVIPAVRSDLDLDADDPALVGKDTSGLFDSQGNPLTEMPPGDTSFILGPMVSVYFPDGDYSAIGYIQKDTRKVINLARIPGTISGWGVGGNVEGFTSYSQLTLEQALWYRDKLINGDTSDYRVFYIGVFEQLNSENPNVFDPSLGIDIDQFGRWIGKILNLGQILEPQRTEVTPGKKGPDPDMPPGIANPLFSLLSNINPGSLAQLGARMFRSITDPFVYAGDYIFKGLGSGIDYLPNFTGASNIGLPKLVDMPGAIARWATGGQANPVSNAIDNTIQAVLGKNYATQYFTPDLSTAVKYAGDGGTVVAIPRTPGMRGWKNWLGSNVSRGFDPSKGVEQLVSTADAVAADVAGKTQKFALSNPDDVAKMTQLATQGAKTNTIIGKLGRAVPFVGAVAAVADFGMRSSKGDYAGALLGGISAIPGPVGWVGLGAQIISDATGVTDPNSPSNQMLKGIVGVTKSIGPGPGYPRVKAEVDRIQTNIGAGGNPNFRIRDVGGSGSFNNYQMVPGVLEGYNLLTEDQFMTDLGDLRAALFELGVPSDRNQYAKEQSALLLSMGINPGMVMLIAKAIQQEPYTPEEEKYLKKNFPILISMFANIRGGLEDNSFKSVKESKEVLTESRKKIVREVKKPYELPEVKTEKIKHRPRVVKSAEDKTRVVGADLMKKAEVPTSFKRLEDTMWKKQERNQNERFSQERKNMILDSIGTSDHAWTWMTEKNHTRSSNSMYENFGNGQKNQIISKKKIGNDYVIRMYNEEGKVEIITQSVLNERLQKQNELVTEQETLNAPNDPLVKRVRKALATKIDYPDKPSKMGYPDQAPLPQSETGFHPEFGKKKDYYKRLDRHSADTMDNVRTGDQEIDSQVSAQTTVEKIKQVLKQRKNK